MLNRRGFLKILSSFGFVLLTPLKKLTGAGNVEFTENELEDGELYEGFLLLEQNAPIPYFVNIAPCPILGSVDPNVEDDPLVVAYRGQMLWFDSIEDLKNNIDFPLYLPKALPDNMNFMQCYVVKFTGSGEIWEARIDFCFENDDEPLASISASPIFSRPYPVWPDIDYPRKSISEQILDEEFYVRKPSKINFTPQKGIIKTTDQGYMIQWIKHDVLYTMSVAYDAEHTTASRIGESLVEK